MAVRKLTMLDSGIRDSVQLAAAGTEGSRKLRTARTFFDRDGFVQVDEAILIAIE